MPNRLQISIVTPSFNQGHFLEETIKSVLEQNYPNLEYIIIDGGSNDESVDVVKKYTNQLAYWVSEPDRGQSHAINKGFGRCTGDIIAWINSDDLYLPGTFSFIADFFANNPDVDLVYGDAEIIDETGKFLMHRKELSTDYLMGFLVGWGFLIPQPAAFWRKSVLEHMGYLNEAFHYAMDYEFWQRTAEQKKIQHITRTFARQRYHRKAKTLHMPKDPRFISEIDRLRKQAYDRLNIHHILPYSLSPVIRNLYRLKRVFLRAIHGHYLKGYIPDPLLRKQI